MQSARLATAFVNQLFTSMQTSSGSISSCFLLPLKYAHLVLFEARHIPTAFPKQLICIFEYMCIHDS